MHGFESKTTTRARRPTVRERVLDRHVCARRQFGVRDPTRRIVHDAVHDALERDGGPKRVVAQIVAHARFRAERDERANHRRRHRTMQIVSLDLDSNGATMIPREIRHASLYRHRRRAVWKLDVAVRIEINLKVALRAAAARGMTFRIRGV